MGNYYLHIDEVFEFDEDWVEVSESDASNSSSSNDSEESISSHISYSDRFADACEDQESIMSSTKSFVMVDKGESSSSQDQVPFPYNEDISMTPIKDTSNDVWVLEFDGSCASVGSSASVVLISP